MPRKPDSYFYFDERRKKWIGYLYEFKQPGKNPPRVDLCKSEEAEYKQTKTGKRRRSASEINQYVIVLYQQKLEEYRLTQAEREKIEVQSSPRISALMQTWLESVAETRSPRTLEIYMRACDMYSQAIPDHPVREYRPEYNTKLINSLKSRGLSAQSQNKYIRALQTFFTWLYDQHHIDRPVKLEKPIPTQSHEIRIYTPAEIEAIFNRIQHKIETEKNKYRRDCYKVHLRAWTLAIETGMRRGEIYSLPLERIVINNPTPFIIIDDVPSLGYVVKSHQTRRVPISANLLSFLRNDLEGRMEKDRYYLDIDGRFLYKDARALSKAIKRHCLGVGISDTDPLHTARSTVATRLLQRGVDSAYVRAILGHQNIKTTLKYYINVSNLPLHDSVNLLDWKNG